MTFTLYADSVTTTGLWTEIQPSVAVSGGRFSVALGEVTALDDTVFNSPSVYLGVDVARVGRTGRVTFGE